MTKSKSSQRWLARQRRDPYVSDAQAQGYRSRAVFKLEEMDRKYRLFRPGMSVLDLGAAPGGWCQYAIRRVGLTGRVVAVDLLPMEPIAGVEFIQGDFRDDGVMQELRDRMRGEGFDLVLSDMAPNLSGNPSVDQPRAMHLAELVAECAGEMLRANGTMVVKLFQGEGYEAFVRWGRRAYAKVAMAKPKASRPQSREVYFVGMGYHSAMEDLSAQPQEP